MNITLEYDTGTEGYDDRMQTELAVGAAPDLFPTWGESEKIKKWVDEEAVHNLGEIINGDPARYPTLYKIINTPEYKAYNKMYLGDENATYAIYSISSLAYPQFNGVPVYNTAILDEVNGGKTPATVDEFVEFTKNAGAAGYSGWWPYNVKLTNWGEMDATIASPMGTTILAPYEKAWQGFIPEGEIGTENEHWTLATTSDKSKEAVKILADMYKNNGLHQGVGVLTDDDDGYSQFAAGRIAAFSYGYGYYTQFHKIYADVWKKAHPDATLADLTMGTALQQDGNWMKRYDTGTWVGANYFVPTSCAYPDRVLDLVEFLATNEGQTLLFRDVYKRQGLLHQLRREALVEMQRPWHFGPFGHTQHHIRVLGQGRAGQQALGRADDHRRAQLLRGSQDALGHLQGHAVEQAHRVMFFAGVGQDGFQIRQHRYSSFNNRWAQNALPHPLASRPDRPPR